MLVHLHCIITNWTGRTFSFLKMQIQKPSNARWVNEESNLGGGFIGNDYIVGLDGAGYSSLPQNPVHVIASGGAPVSGFGGSPSESPGRIIGAAPS